MDDLKFVDVEATRGIQMSPSFDGVLKCCQMKMAANVMLETASKIQGYIALYIL